MDADGRRLGCACNDSDLKRRENEVVEELRKRFVFPPEKSSRKWNNESRV